MEDLFLKYFQCIFLVKFAVLSSILHFYRKLKQQKIIDLFLCSKANKQVLLDYAGQHLSSLPPFFYCIDMFLYRKSLQVISSYWLLF